MIGIKQQKDLLASSGLSLPAHDVAEFLQVARGEIIVVAITALDVFVYSVQVEGDRVQQLNLEHEKLFSAQCCCSVCPSNTDAGWCHSPHTVRTV